MPIKAKAVQIIEEADKILKIYRSDASMGAKEGDLLRLFPEVLEHIREFGIDPEFDELDAKTHTSLCVVILEGIRDSLFKMFKMSQREES